MGSPDRGGLALVALLAPLPGGRRGAAPRTPPTRRPPSSSATSRPSRSAPTCASAGPASATCPIPVDTIFGRPDVVLRDESGAVLKVAPTAADLAGGPQDRWIDLPGNALTPGCTYERWFRDARRPDLDLRPRRPGGRRRRRAVLAVLGVQPVERRARERLGDGAGDDSRRPRSRQALQTSRHVRLRPARGRAVRRSRPTTTRWASSDDGTPPDRVLRRGLPRLVLRRPGCGSARARPPGSGATTPPGRSRCIEPELIVLPEGDDPPTTGPFAWLSYQGHWGEQQPAFANGPTGPVHEAAVVGTGDVGRRARSRAGGAGAVRLVAGDRRCSAG